MAKEALTYEDIQAWQEEVYLDLHRHPELSMQEHRTRERIAKELRGMGLDPVEIGGGVVATISRGEGPTVLVRADFDGLPVKEATGLEYASTDEATDPDGQTVPVMHACGHDIHVSTLLAAGRLLDSDAYNWKGTLHLLFQPGEETGEGSASMVDDGLAAKLATPNVVLGQHVFCNEIPTGSVGLRPGPFMSTATQVDITFRGVGSHGSMPHLGVDPVLMASATVVRLQGIVARELRPHEFGVVTVGVIEGGSKANVIPDTCKLQLTVRAYSAEVLEQMVSAIERIARAESEASGSPHAPEIYRHPTFPVVDNNATVTEKLGGAFTNAFGADRVCESEPLTASEDFAMIAKAFNAPYCFWALGGSQEGVNIPNHSPFFAPEMQPTLRTGTEALVAAALEFLDTE